jgi:hypothetical protein
MRKKAKMPVASVFFFFQGLEKWNIACFPYSMVVLLLRGKQFKMNTRLEYSSSQTATFC